MGSYLCVDPDGLWDFDKCSKNFFFIELLSINELITDRKSDSLEDGFRILTEETRKLIFTLNWENEMKLVYLRLCDIIKLYPESYLWISY